MRSVLLAIALCAPAALAQEVKLAFVEGPVAVVPSGGGAEQPASAGTILHPGDTVQTREGARVEIEVPGGSIIRLGESTRLTVTDSVPQRAFSARLFLGNLWTKVHKLVAGESFQVETENGVAGVRGTEFRVEAAPGQPDLIRVYEGAVQVGDDRVEPGQELRFRRGAKAELKTFDPQSERGHRFMEWVRSRPEADGSEPGKVRRQDRNPERENLRRERRQKRREQ